MNIPIKYKKYAILRLAIAGINKEELYNLYTKKANEHNLATNENEHYNAGFDLFVPSETQINGGEVAFIKMGVKAEMIDHKNNPISYYMYPRSSISKTPLMVANHVGIIDSGYRGELTGAFRNVGGNGEYVVEKHTRLMQVCSPTLSPLYVYICENEAELSETVRGEGGFGSTGK